MKFDSENVCSIIDQIVYFSLLTILSRLTTQSPQDQSI